MSIRFGIIGCGMIARFHARALSEIDDAQLVACTSRSADAARAFANDHACRAFDSLDDMLTRGDVDAVCICTPSGAHLEPAVAAARAGKHVVVEKPLEVTTVRCDRIIDACRSAGVLLTTIFQSRFQAAAQAMKQAMDHGRFGHLALGSAYVKWFRTQQYYDSGAWRGTWELDGGGALMNQAIHTVDLLQWIMGPVQEVAAWTATRAHERIEVEDTVVANLRFRNGALGTIEATTAAWPGWLRRLEICGSTGSAVLEDDAISRWEFSSPEPMDDSLTSSRREPAGVSGGATDPSAISHAAHASQLRDLVAAIADRRPPAIDGSEARKSVEIITAIYQSARTGGPVELNDPKREW